MCWAGFFPVTPLPYEMRTQRSHRSLSGDLLNYWCCHLMRGVGVCVHREYFFVYQKVWHEYSKREAWEKTAESVGPWNRITYIPHRALSLAWFGAWVQVVPLCHSYCSGSPHGWRKAAEASVSVQKKRFCTGLTVASVWTTWWLSKQTELHSSQPVLVWHSPSGVCLEEWLNVF